MNYGKQKKPFGWGAGHAATGRPGATATYKPGMAPPGHDMHRDHAHAMAQVHTQQAANHHAAYKALVKSGDHAAAASAKAHLDRHVAEARKYGKMAGLTKTSARANAEHVKAHIAAHVGVARRSAAPHKLGSQPAGKIVGNAHPTLSGHAPATPSAAAKPHDANRAAHAGRIARGEKLGPYRHDVDYHAPMGRPGKTRGFGALGRRKELDIPIPADAMDYELHV